MTDHLTLKEKEIIAIKRLKTFEPTDGEPYYLCYSGGKDSDAIRILAALANVKHEIHHNLTTVDTPETVQYIKSIPGVQIEKAKYKDGSPKTMWNLIVKKKLPPTRIMRWCCTELKEWGGQGRLRIAGIRWDESHKRKNNRDVINIIGKERDTQKRLEEMGLDFSLNQMGGVKMHMDNEMAREQGDFLQHCYRDRTVTVNPIVDWTTEDVWTFLHHYGCDGNPLYQCGQNRIGCICCPLSGSRQMQADLRRYPKYKAAYIRAFDRMLKVREAEGKTNKCNWQNGYDVLRWWVGDTTDPNQLSFFDDDEVYDIMSEMR